MLGLQLTSMFKKMRFMMLLGLIFSPSISYANIQAKRVSQPIAVDVVEISDLSQLKLYLYDAEQQPYRDLQRLKQALARKCNTMNFAMNAGMYHADLAPVGLYVENGLQKKALNRATRGFGNFLIQPNGVLAWNDKQAVILTTQKYASTDFKARYATQSGPMLVVDGKINPNFIPQSDSLKIRNGVGIKNGKLYFVISREGVSFYAFAQYFKQQLSVNNALYLDGSVSSADIQALNRHDSSLKPLGPIVAYTTASQCKQ